jgi:hypothetical protein
MYPAGPLLVEEKYPKKNPQTKLLETCQLEKNARDDSCGRKNHRINEISEELRGS